MSPKKKTRPTLCLTTAQLRTLCDQAEALHFSNGPNAKFWQDVDHKGINVVAFWFVHRPNLAFWKGIDHPWDFSHGGGKNIRAHILCKMRNKWKPQDLLCDFDYDAFMALFKQVGGKVA